MVKASKDFEKTKQLMGALVRMKPKPHEAMKVGTKMVAKKSASKKKPGK